MAANNPYVDDADEPMVAMNMDADYEGGEFINGEFFYRNKRERKAQTAEQAIYGIWADEEDDGWRGGSRGGSAADSLSKPMNFVSKGVVSNVDSTPAQPADSSTASAGSGSRSASSAAGLGSAKSSGVSGRTNADASAEAAAAPPPKLEFKTFGKRSRGSTDEKKKPAAPAAPAPVSLDKDFGKFEQHTKGIGLKLLQKMGFTGRLGKSEQGIAIPLQPKAVAPVIGKNLFQSHVAARTKEEEERLAREQKEKVSKVKAAPSTSSGTPNWSRGAKRVKREYKTAEDLTKPIVTVGGDAAGDLAEPNAPQPMVIIDATGPQVKVTTLDKITTRQATAAADDTPTGAARSGRLPELQHNVRLMVDLVESDIHKLDRERRHMEDSIVMLEHQHDQLQASLLHDQDIVHRTEELLHAVEAIQTKLASLDMSSGRVTSGAVSNADVAEQVNSLAALVGSLQQRFPDEYRSHNLSALVSACTFPALKTYLSKWLPLFPMSSAGARGTLEVLPQINKWRSILAEGIDGDRIWRKFLRQLVVPRVMSAMSGWSPRDPQPMVVLVKSLKTVLFEDIYSDLLLRTLVPRLLQEVQRWNPRVDRTLTDQWLHPWNGVIPEEAMQPIYRDIRAKLGDVLQAWHASDQSALFVVAPWHKVWRDEEFEAFLVRFIIPKLGTVLHEEFVVTPHQQNLAPFEWVMRWERLINPRLLTKLLESFFFPKWFTALYTWLNQEPRFDEVSSWYTGWKEQFPQSLRENPAVKLHFNRALDLMNAALEGQALLPIMQRIMQSFDSQPGRLGATPALSVGVKQAVAASAAAALRSKKLESASAAEAPEDEEMNFRDVVEKYAEIHNLAFLPNVKRGKFDGKQIYLFGRVSLYLNNGVVYTADKDDDAQSPALWRPVPLDQLLTRAKEKEGLISKPSGGK